MQKFKRERERVKSFSKNINFKRFSFLLIFVLSFIFLNTPKAEAATLYFNAAVNNNWNTLGNWWNDAGFTSPAVALPTASDDVIIVGVLTSNQNDVVRVTSNTGPAASVNTLTVNGNSRFANISITVANGVVFNDTSLMQDSAVINGNVTFNGFNGKWGGGTINGNVIFGNASDGVASFYLDQFFNFSNISGTITGGDGLPITTYIFNDSSLFVGTISGDAIFNGTSSNGYDGGAGSGTVTGDATYNDFSRNLGTVQGNAVFNDNSKNGRSGWVPNGVVSGNAFFYDSSKNEIGYTVSGDACFATTATNTGTVSGTVTVCSTSSPSVTTGSYVSINSTSGALIGTVGSTGGVSFTSQGFEYGLDTNYGTTASNSGTFNSENFTKVITGLTCATTYHYRAFAVNAIGTTNGNDATFTTASCSEQAQALYGADGAGGGVANLYTLDPLTGDKLTTIGSTGYGIAGLAFDPTDGVLYGTSGNSDATHPKSLFTINTTTGAATWLGTIKTAGNVSVGPMPDIAFSSDGTLYGARAGYGFLYTIDPTSCNGTSDTNCLATSVSSNYYSMYQGLGVVFNNNDELYMFSNSEIKTGDYVPSVYYVQINPNTGRIVDVSSFSNIISSSNRSIIHAARFNANGVLYVARLNYQDPPADLAIIDLDTNTIISLGNNTDMQLMTAIAFSPATPTVTTTTASSITETEATSGGNVTNSGGAVVTARGVVWDTSANPTTTLSTKTSDGTGTGSFVSNITGLTSGTTYHYRAYATNAVGTSYGSDLTFTTNNPVPTFTTLSPTTTTMNSSSFTLTVTGTNFVSDSVVKWNDTSLTTTYVSATELTATVPSTNILSPGTANITVTNSTPGGGTTDPLTFTIKSSYNSGGGSYISPKPITPTIQTTNTTNTVKFTKPSTGSGHTTYDFGPNTLKRGNKGFHVKELQRFLNDTYNANLILDEVFGRLTLSFVKRFQSEHNLKVDGIVGPLTKEGMGRNGI